jgi:branched-chain amino acid transport system ATP-binding protein
MALLEAHRLHKRFGDRVVLERIDLAFEEGRLSGIIGPNGAGKTTCFHVLTGRYRPDGGRIVLDGRDITGLTPRAIARMGISRSFQLMNLFDDFSALENVALAVPERRQQGFHMLRDARQDSSVADKAAAVLARVGLVGKERELARNLSYGDRRALEICVALAAEPRILFLDEPTSGLGAEATARLADLVRGLKEEVTLVIIEHNMRFLFDLADTVAVIQWGQVIARGTPETLRADKWVKASNLGMLA